MKKFVLKLIFASSLILIINVAIYFFLLERKISLTGIGEDVQYSLEKVKIENNKTTVIIGDSVCNQLWNLYEDTDDECHLASNQAITCCGCFLLLREYLENNSQTEEVLYIVRPSSLANDMWKDFTYQYFVVNFYNDRNKEYIDSSTIDVLNEKYGKLFIDNNIVKWTLLNNNKLLDIYLKSIKASDEIQDTTCISEQSAIYLKKMDDLCKENGVDFIVISDPLADTEQNHMIQGYAESIETYGLSAILDGYLDSIIYYPEDCFVEDGVHLTGKTLENKEEIKKVMIEEYLRE